MSILSILGVGIIAVISYQAICMWQDMRQQDTLDRAASSIEQILARNSELMPVEMWSRVDELLVSLGDVRAKVHGTDGQVLYGPQVLLSQEKHKVSAMYPLVGLGGNMPMRDLELAIDVSEEKQFLNFIALLFTGVSVVWGAFILLLSGTFARFQLKPLNKFGRKIADFDPSNLTARIEGDHEPEELYPVIEQFNKLMGKVGQYHDQLRAFNSNVAHELNTPLSSLTVSHELLLREKNTDPAHLREALHSHLEELQRMNRIIQSMLFLSHASQGQYKDFRQIEKLSELVIPVMDYMEAMVDDKHLKFDLQGDAGAKVDAELIKRALSNLVSNAIRYAEEGSIIHVNIQQEATTGLVKITVSNKGVCIPEASVPHLFEPFYRVDQARKESGQNHGLGLAIVAAIARLHGGEPFAQNDAGWVQIGFTVRN
ncbi:ATP-binding protein [Limnobacter parvus]|uniref:histidine kinase n=1 Tax=Limnobacter parvus TaxID=2939690 RepID=A0ABT1XJE4_9BURK|nr:ATP-binding protein [Limnobacter parvus]MCR2747284.1 ATP-binding protein [Limnobacter parvus]